MEDSVVGIPIDKIPNETYFTISTSVKSAERFAYIPSAISDSVLITSSLSSVLHLLIIGSESE
jgi:hypothetical protein